MGWRNSHYAGAACVPATPAQVDENRAVSMCIPSMEFLMSSPVPAPAPTPTPRPVKATASSVDKKTAKNLALWQPAVVKAGAKQKRCVMADFDPAAKPFSSGDKATDMARVEALASELDALQNIFYADKRFKLLVILQGTDTSGKDGTLRSVFSRVSPLGVRTIGWKAPNDDERAHDYLRRIHEVVPGDGEIMIFNRSHYEDVLVPAVKGHITPAQTAQRFAHINDFERMLTQTGTVILKFMLHIGFDEQRRRLQERLDDPTKHWKFDVGDLDARQQWTHYQAAYAALLQATSSAWARWTVVPANSKTHRNLMIATLVCNAMRDLRLRYPPASPALDQIKIA